LEFNKKISSTKHGKIERKNRILKEKLRMYVMHQPKKWEDYLPLAEFVYKIRHQESLKTSLYEALYGRSCNNPISWSDPINKVLIGPNILKEMEQQIQVIK